MIAGRVLGIFVTVFSFSLLLVDSNAQATLWLIGGRSLTTQTAANFHGLLLLHHRGGLTGGFSVDCTILLVGVVGPGALGMITSIEGLKGESEKESISCEYTEGGTCGARNELVIVHFLNLPWHTLLELSGGLTMNHFLLEVQKVPGYEVTCKTLKGSCEGSEFNEFSNNGGNGAIFEFKATLESLCTDGGKGTILGLGEMLGTTVS